MSKKLFSAVLLLAVTTFFFSGCNYDEDNGPSPVINQVFFFKINDSTIAPSTDSSILWESRIKESDMPMSVYDDKGNPNYYGIYFSITDEDKNSGYISMSFNGNDYYFIEGRNRLTQNNTTVPYTIIFQFTQWEDYSVCLTDGPIYFRVEDFAKNKSNTYTVPASVVSKKTAAN